MYLIGKTIEVTRQEYDPDREGIVTYIGDEYITICESDTERLYDLKWNQITTIRIIE